MGHAQLPVAESTSRLLRQPAQRSAPGVPACWHWPSAHPGGQKAESSSFLPRGVCLLQLRGGVGVGVGVGVRQPQPNAPARLTVQLRWHQQMPPAPAGQAAYPQDAGSALAETCTGSVKISAGAETRATLRTTHEHAEATREECINGVVQRLLASRGARRSKRSGRVMVCSGRKILTLPRAASRAMLRN